MSQYLDLVNLLFKYFQSQILFFYLKKIFLIKFFFGKDILHNHRFYFFLIFKIICCKNSIKALTHRSPRL